MCHRDTPRRQDYDALLFSRIADDVELESSGPEAQLIGSVCLDEEPHLRCGRDKDVDSVVTLLRRLGGARLDKGLPSVEYEALTGLLQLCRQAQQ